MHRISKKTCSFPFVKKYEFITQCKYIYSNIGLLLKGHLLRQNKKSKRVIYRQGELFETVEKKRHLKQICTKLSADIIY